MFVCQTCGTLTQPGESQKTIVVEWRRKHYPSQTVERKLGDFRPRFYPGGEGYEAAVTAHACPACVASGVAKDAPVPEIHQPEPAPMPEPVRELSPKSTRLSPGKPWRPRKFRNQAELVAGSAS